MRFRSAGNGQLPDNTARNSRWGRKFYHPGRSAAWIDIHANLSSDELVVNYTLPPNTVLTGPDPNFFGIMFNSPYQDVQFEMQPGVYDFYQVSTSCTTFDPLNPTCGSDNPIYGANFVPEPSYFTLLASGALAMLGLRRWRAHFTRRRHDSEFEAC